MVLRTFFEALWTATAKVPTLGVSSWRSFLGACVGAWVRFLAGMVVTVLVWWSRFPQVIGIPWGPTRRIRRSRDPGTLTPEDSTISDAWTSGDRGNPRGL